MDVDVTNIMIEVRIVRKTNFFFDECRAVSFNTQRIEGFTTLDSLTVSSRK